MKNIKFNFFLVILCLLSLSVSEALPKNDADNFYWNPLLLNDKPVDSEMLSSYNRGKLSLIQGNPDSQSKTKVPFYIYLKRAGKIVDTDSYAHNNTVVEFELGEILKSAKAGDQIVIDPADKNHTIERKIIVVKQGQLGYQFQWFYGLNKKDGC